MKNKKWSWALALVSAGILLISACEKQSPSTQKEDQVNTYISGYLSALIVPLLDKSFKAVSHHTDHLGVEYAVMQIPKGENLAKSLADIQLGTGPIEKGADITKIKKAIVEAKIDLNSQVVVKFPSDAQAEVYKDGSVRVPLGKVWWGLEITEISLGESQYPKVALMSGEFGLRGGVLFVKEGTRAKLKEQLYTYSNGCWTKTAP